MNTIELRPINKHFTHRKTKKDITHSEYMEILWSEIDKRWKEMPENIRTTKYENEWNMFAACVTDFDGEFISEWDNFEEYYPSDENGKGEIK